MRIKLAAAVALGPLMLASGAMAQSVTISNTRTTPVVTSTVNNGSAADVLINSSGRVEVANGTAVTINSDNDFEIDSGGRVLMSVAGNNAIGVLIQGGVTSDVTVGGEITLDDGFSGSDTDNDDDLDGAFATGSGRFGIRLVGPGDLTGDIIVEDGGNIRIEGNDSFGISLESGLIGDLRTRGTVSVLGDRTIGIRNTGTIDGLVRIGGNVRAQGEDAVAVSLEGDILGALIIDGAVASTGFRYTGSLSDEEIEALDADDLLDGGPAVIIAADVQGGVLLDRANTDFDDDDTNEDEDGDGINDDEETTANIQSFGSGPAVLVGSTTRTVTLDEVGTGDEAFGFINRGAVTGNGLYDGFAGTGLQFGIDGGQAVTINGGFLNEGSLQGSANEAGAVGLRITGVVTTPVIDNSGTIIGSARSDGLDDAVAIDIQLGANVPSLVNSGTILSAFGGEEGSSYAVRDTSGTLSSITNTGSITASVVATDDEDDTDDDNEDIDDEVVNGTAYALDLRANTSGVTLIQDGVNDGDDGDDGEDDADEDEDGVDDFDEPEIIGEIVLGSGADTVDIRNGQVIGGLEFGLGNDSLLISGGATVTSALNDADGLLDIVVTNGVLDARQNGQIDVTSLTVGSEGTLIVRVDPGTGTVNGFRVNGNATFADGAGLGLTFNTLLEQDTRFNIITADTLSIGAIDQDVLQTNSAYLYVLTAGADEAAGQVFVDVRRRTAVEFGFIASEAAAYDAIYSALALDEGLRDAFLSQTNRADFINLYEQMLPEHSGGPLLSLSAGVDAVTRALIGRGTPAREGETSAWIQEINFYADKDKTDTYGFRSEGFGIAAAYERGTDLGAFGVSAAFTSSDLEDPEAEAEEQLSARLLELGLYWRAQGENWTVWARAAGGYASFESVRQFVIPGINRRNSAEWTGWSASAAAGAAYSYNFGRYSLRPEVYVEYFRLSEEGYTESGGGDGFDLEVQDRDGHLLAGTASVVFGAAFGQDRWFRPELRLGWRQNISYDPGDTVARFAAGGNPFTLSGDTIEGGGPTAGIKLNFGNELGFLAFEADAEMIEDYLRYSILLRATFRF